MTMSGNFKSIKNKINEYINQGGYIPMNAIDTTCFGGRGLKLYQQYKL